MASTCKHCGATFERADDFYKHLADDHAEHGHTHRPAALDGMEGASEVQEPGKRKPRKRAAKVKTEPAAATIETKPPRRQRAPIAAADPRKSPRTPRAKKK